MANIDSNADAPMTETDSRMSTATPASSPTALRFSTPMVPTPTTWSFVQMNMSLLPIARPRPVTTPQRIHDASFQKPRTPNQKLHRRVLQNASNISPRRHDVGSNSAVRRRNNATDLSVTQDAPLRIAVPIARFLQTADATSRETPIRPRTGCKRAYETSGCGYASDSSPSIPMRMKLPLARSVSLSAAGDAPAAATPPTTYRGKRILELLDEERRLSPDEPAAPSPTKRSRRE